MWTFIFFGKKLAPHAENLPCEQKAYRGSPALASVSCHSFSGAGGVGTDCLNQHRKRQSSAQWKGIARQSKQPHLKEKNQESKDNANTLQHLFVFLFLHLEAFALFMSTEAHNYAFQVGAPRILKPHLHCSGLRY